MKKSQVKRGISMVAAAAGLVLAGGVIAAPLSTHSQYNGYQKCVKAAKKETSGLVIQRTYLLNRTAKTNLYYLNGTAWEEGDRTSLRVACETSRNGRNLMSMTVENGRFVLDPGSVRVDVATR